MKTLWHVIQILGIALAFLVVLLLLDLLAGSFVGVVAVWSALIVGVFAVRLAMK